MSKFEFNASAVPIRHRSRTHAAWLIFVAILSGAAACVVGVALYVAVITGLEGLEVALLSLFGVGLVAAAAGFLGGTLWGREP